MTWLVQEQKTQKELAGEFSTAIRKTEILKIMGAHDGMAALTAKKVGFEALYLSGAAFTASRGLPDLGILHSQEVAERARELVRATNLPILVDIDTGFGGVLNVARTAKEMVEANVAAVQIEDQDLPKKCGHLNGKKLIPADEMAAKIRAIKEVAPSLVVVARTDALSVEGLDAAIERMKLYVEAGADALFPEALTTKEEFEKVGAAFDVPLLANMTEFGRTEYHTAEEFQNFGFSMVIYPVTSLRAAAKAFEIVFQEIFDKGTQVDVLDQMQTRRELYETIELEKYESLDGKIAKTIIPE
ncbi:methylisocitrate lyase [Sporosarcina sp. P12(2017)]|uniref:methylisocitrate lyase n=1 Tax=unclassified Sporosarcina TaxID=2647733 RepID=UPI000C16E507|nr:MULTISPECIES: methylisocitrate lyase [unclassified Sporosarcina]PIC57098.1 methylisocitrate lyase [Sporosarcina sp. P10]PIC60480.1 methylisocitrate lyase [Sporosarcina sp. P12(2017)]